MMEPKRVGQLYCVYMVLDRAGLCNASLSLTPLAARVSYLKDGKMDYAPDMAGAWRHAADALQARVMEMQISTVIEVQE